MGDIKRSARHSSLSKVPSLLVSTFQDKLIARADAFALNYPSTSGNNRENCSPNSVYLVINKKGNVSNDANRNQSKTLMLRKRAKEGIKSNTVSPNRNTRRCIIQANNEPEGVHIICTVYTQ